MAENLGGGEARTLGYDSFQNPPSVLLWKEIATWKLVLALLLPPPYNPSFNAVNLLVREVGPREEKPN